MLGMFGKADPAKLQAAIDQAKEAGVSAAKLADAEAALEKAHAGLGLGLGLGKANAIFA